MAMGSGAPDTACARSFLLALATGSVGCRDAINQTRIMSTPASVAVGSTPATNISPMETGPADPRTT